MATTTWKIEVDGTSAETESSNESLLTIGNGRTGTRGSLEEGYSFSTPATYLAGVFKDDGENRVPVIAKDWTRLNLLLNGTVITLDSGTTIGNWRELNIRTATLRRRWVQEVNGRLIKVTFERFASLANRNVMAIRATATSDHPEDELTWVAPHIAYSEKSDGGGRHSMVAKDDNSGATITRIVGVCTDQSSIPSIEAANRIARSAAELGYDALLYDHVCAWDVEWARCHTVVKPALQKSVNIATYHLIISADPERETVSIGARGLSGSNYMQHVFWDTEVFALPFFIKSHPKAARAMLAYRYHNLAGAREKALKSGYLGALYPWESADTGKEVTPEFSTDEDGNVIPILSGLIEHHISADVSWSVWRYYEATKDHKFLEDMGAEIILETARFWISRVTLRDNEYHIDNVVGPDEYHEEVNDNAFTNFMAKWNIERAIEVASMLEMNVEKTEIDHMKEIAECMYTGQDSETGIYEQHAGFFGLDDVDMSKLGTLPVAADMVLGRDVTLNAKIVKQADVILLMHMFPEEFTKEEIAANYDYYEPITCHGSSLSPAIHSAVASKLGRTQEARKYIDMAIKIDIANSMGNAGGGMHTATIGGIWQAAQLIG